MDTYNCRLPHLSGSRKERNSMPTILITTVNKKGKAKTFMYGKPVHLLAAAAGTAAHVINHTSKLMGKEILRKIRF